MDPIFFQTIDWNNIPGTEYTGETGIAHWRTVQYDRFRMRMVEYSEDYRADHWYLKSHLVYCPEGEMISELPDGRTFRLSAGMSYQVSDGIDAHRSYSQSGAKLLIIDSGFLKPSRTLNANPWRM